MDGDTPKDGETRTPKAPENGTPTPPAPPAGNASEGAGEAERLRKELEQAKMRENQLLNEKKAKEEAEAKQRAKELEEQNEFKSLYEQEKAKREAIETERKAEEERKELDKKKSEVLTDYSDEVKALAEEAGMALGSTDEADVNTYREKLDKVQKMVGTGKVGPNNPGKSSGKLELSQDELRMALKDPGKFQEIISQRPGIAALMAPRR